MEDIWKDRRMRDVRKTKRGENIMKEMKVLKEVNIKEYGRDDQEETGDEEKWNFRQLRKTRLEFLINMKGMTKNVRKIRKERLTMKKCRSGRVGRYGNKCRSGNKFRLGKERILEGKEDQEGIYDKEGQENLNGGNVKERERI